VILGCFVACAPRNDAAGSNMQSTPDACVQDVPPYPASASSTRAQLRAPLWNELISYFSFGE